MHARLAPSSLRSSLLLVPLALVALTSCKSGDTSISITDDEGLLPQAASIEFAVFEGGCPAEEDLTSTPFPASVRSQVISYGEDFESIGKLDAANYGFGIFLRDGACSMIGYGCTPADLTNIRKIPIPIYSVSSSAGVCAEGTTCDGNGRCGDGGGQGGSSGAGGAGGAGAGGASGAAGTAGTGGSGGEPANTCKLIGSQADGCQLKVVGWGELPKTRSPSSRIGTPAVTATDAGFVVGYHEVVSDGSQSFSLVGVKADGCYTGSFNTAAQPFTNTCSSSDLPLDASAAWNSTKQSGLLTFARPLCSGVDFGGGFGLVSFNASGVISDASPVNSPDKTFKFLSYAAPNAVAPSTTSDFVVSAIAQPTPGSVVFSFPVNDGAASGGADPFNGAPQMPVTNPVFSGVARDSTLQVDALQGTLADSTSGLLLSLARDSVTKVFVQRPASQRAVVRPSGNRVLVYSKNTAGEVEWTVLSDDGQQLYPEQTGGAGGAAGAAGAGGAAGASPGTNEPLNLPNALGFDATVLDNRAIMFVGQDQTLQIKVINGLNAAISSGNIVSYNTGQIPSLSGFNGKQLAVSSASGRVVVAWTNQEPSAGTPIGGVAVLRCE